MSELNERFRGNLKVAVVVIGMFVLTACGVARGQQVEVVNPSDKRLRKELVSLPVEQLPGTIQENRLVVRNPDGESLPAQTDDLDGDGNPDELLLQVDLSPGERKVLRIRSGGQRTEPDVFSEGTARSFQNEHLRVEAFQGKPEAIITVPFQGYQRVDIPEGDPSVRVIDRESGQTLIEQWVFQANRLALDPDKRKLVQREVVSRGPLRMVVDYRHALKNSSFQVTERFILYRKRPVLTYELRFHNPTEKTMDLPSFTGKKQVLRGRQGSLLTKNGKEVEMLSVNFFSSTRPNMMWVNPTTGYGMGVSMDSYIDWYGPLLWKAKVYSGFNGRYLHARPKHQWVIPDQPLHPETLDGRGERDRIGKIGPLGRFLAPPESNKKPMFKHRWNRMAEDPPLPAVGPGRTRTYRFQFSFYNKPEDPGKIIDEFEQDSNRPAGRVHVYDSDGNVLRVAGWPEHLSESFDRSSSHRWLTDDSVDMKVQKGTAQITSSRSGQGIRIPFTRDFIDATELRGRIEQLGDRTELTFTLEEIDTGERHLLSRRSSTGSFRLPLEDQLPFNGRRRCMLHIDLVGGQNVQDPRLSAVLSEVHLSWITPSAPELVSPGEGASITDLALTYSINSRTPHRTDVGYELQVAKDQSFDNLILTDRYPSNMRVSGGSHRNRTFVPDDLPQKGSYYWRARGIGVHGVTGPWSDPYRVEIDSTDHTPKEPVRDIGPNRPLIYLPGNRPKQFRRFLDAISDDVSEHIVCKLSYQEVMNEKNFQRWLDLDIPLMMRFYGHTEGDLASLESLYRKHEKLIGFDFGESGMPDASMFRGVQLSAKYGRFAGNFGGLIQLGLGANKDFYDLLKTHGSYVVALPKGMHPGFVGERYGPTLGLWLSGRLDFWACETEWWVPNNIGIPDEQIRAVDWMPPFLFGLATGANVWRIETFFSHKKSHGWPKGNDEKQKLGPLWTNGMGDFFKDMLKHDLIPDREDVLSEVRVAMRSRSQWVQYPGSEFPADRVETAHGRTKGSRQWIPGSNRHYAVPMLPPHVTGEEEKRFPGVVDVEKFESLEETDSFFDRVNGSSSEAFAVLVGDTGIITNRHAGKWSSEGFPEQSYTLEFTKGPVESISGQVGYHQYVIAKQKRNQLFLHTNNYPDRETTLTITPEEDTASIRVEPETALVDKHRSNDGTTVTVQHEEGVVRLFVEQE